MKLAKPNEQSINYFKSIVPDDYRVSTRPMFGNLAAFVNGNMFMGLYGDEIFVRLAEEDRPQLMEEKGASVFAPVAGRMMKEYIVLPQAFRKDPEKIAGWVNRSLEWCLTLPPKTKSASRVTARKKNQRRVGSSGR
jgi:TfoX/Sxy family transcriptional regulator of competence genes